MTDQSLRVVFAGTPDFSVPPLRALLQSHHQVVAVYTQPDRPAGRGRKLRASPVKECALNAEVPVYQPERLRGQGAINDLAVLKPDVMVVVAYGLILPRGILEVPRLGCVNIHASLLPRWRGAAPIQRAILEGDSQTGVTLIQMDAGLDTGAMLKKIPCNIDSRETAQSLHDKLSELGAGVIVPVLDDLAAGRAVGEPQDHDQSTYARKLAKEEAWIDWRQAALTIDRAIRAFTPWPVARTAVGDRLLMVLQAQPVPGQQGEPGVVVAADKEGVTVATGDGGLLLERVQLAGGKPLQAYDLVNGNILAVGARLGGSIA